MRTNKHIFISYKREDQRFARSLRTALKAVGSEVWWDEQIQAGERWSERLDKALLDASAILVLWSEKSVDSEWVKHESSIAKIHDKLVQVSIDGTNAPTAFESIQCADLAGWNGSEEDVKFKKLAGAIRRISSKQFYKSLFKSAWWS
jgi:hypothetical protein